METLVFQSPKKHRIIAVKKLLSDNNIPITSIKLHVFVKWSHGGRRGGGRITDSMERRDELNVPIEEFSGKLNDSQTFEIYTYEKYEDNALELIENINEETLFGDCIFKSKCYDEVFEKYLLLQRNNIPCDEIVAIDEEYLLFMDIENIDKAKEILEPNNQNRTIHYEYKISKPKENRSQENRDNNIFKYILPLIIIIIFLFIRIDNEFIVEKIIHKIKEIIGI
jgi:hypothetical protein